jgi:hypothetical protein
MVFAARRQDGRMTWTAPTVKRIDEPFAGDERAMLEGLLDWQRQTLLHKCAGLTGEQLDHSYLHERFGPMSLRWGILHMIEEYARHNGQADLLRERIDGVTGS